MLHTSNVYTQRLTLKCIRPDEWLGSRISTFRRHRSWAAVKRKPAYSGTKEPIYPEHHPRKPFRSIDHFQKPSDTRRPNFGGADYKRFGQLDQSSKPAVIPVIKESDILSYFHGNVNSWASSEGTQHRMVLFGIPGQDSRKLLHTFVNDVEAGRLSTPPQFTYYGLERFSYEHDNTSIDVIYSTIFFQWASLPQNQKRLESLVGVQRRTLDRIATLLQATNRQFPGDEYPQTRAIRRKFIMHVGPTNSGKTHHALRALAAAKRGVYAGPLRLLAHEIWHRLNSGQIVPLNVQVDPNDKTAYNAKPEYIRACNMLTGEEQKLVDGATLLSCTVEMLSYQSKYDVAVIDEIQMIGDEARGGGWTNAVLGLAATEIHLCGEETAIPVVENLLQHTGDELIVKRYERLTPLTVEDQSLGGDVNNVRKGDCIVTFSRRSIFDLKKTVESRTGLKCAVVYGRLPPEVRSEQAALFNDPKSGYDIIIGSDAIGMGLNLKIKRVIFQAMQKMNSGSVTPLPVSSVKQIAGRAGRYGLHESGTNAGGTTTTLFEPDLGLLRRTLPLPYKPLSFARIGTPTHMIEKALSILPPGTTIETAIRAAQYIGRLPYYMRYMEFSQAQEVYNYIDSEWQDMSIDDKVQVLYAPVPWRDEHTTKIVKRLLSIHRQNFTVTLEDITRDELFLQTMENFERLMKAEEAQARVLPSQSKKASHAKYRSTILNLSILESFHKLLVFYTWMSLRNSIVYSDSTVPEVKERLERVLNWALMDMSKNVITPMANAPIRSIEIKTTEKSKDLPPAFVIPQSLNGNLAEPAI